MTAAEEVCMPMGGMFIMLKDKREMYVLGSDVDNYLSLNSRAIAAANSM